MRSPNKVEKLAYLYGSTYYTPKVKMCGISKVETIPAVVEANQTTWALYLLLANDKLL